MGGNINEISTSQPFHIFVMVLLSGALIAEIVCFFVGYQIGKGLGTLQFIGFSLLFLICLITIPAFLSERRRIDKELELFCESIKGYYFKVFYTPPGCYGYFICQLPEIRIEPLAACV